MPPTPMRVVGMEGRPGVSAGVLRPVKAASAPTTAAKATVCWVTASAALGSRELVMVNDDDLLLMHRSAGVRKVFGALEVNASLWDNNNMVDGRLASLRARMGTMKGVTGC